MTRKSRLAEPDLYIDQLEIDWWNANALPVEDIWTLPLPLRRACRQHYIRKIEKFFESGRSKSKPTVVLEIGCGSGWVGQLIAHPGRIHIEGIDVSAAQIQLAKDSARSHGIESACSYKCVDLKDWIRQSKQESGLLAVDCVLIHAILHHLSWKEIHEFFELLKAVPPKTKVFIYEPAYLEATGPRNRIAEHLFSFLNKLPGQWSLNAVKGYEAQLNEELSARIETLFRQAESEGWVLSPKEAVFGEQELFDLLSTYFRVERKYLCNYHSLFSAQKAGFYQSTEVYKPFLTWIVPLSRLVDEILFRSGLLRLATESYAFLGFECVSK